MKILEKKKIVVEEKNGKEKGGPHLEAAIISWGEKKMEREKEGNKFGLGKYILCVEKKTNGEGKGVKNVVSRGQGPIFLFL